MSRKTIKTEQSLSKRKCKTQTKMPEVSVKLVKFSDLQATRAQIKTQDELAIARLVADDRIDLEKRYSRKYIEEVAKELGWKVWRVERAIASMSAKVKFFDAAMKAAANQGEGNGESTDNEPDTSSDTATKEDCCV